MFNRRDRSPYAGRTLKTKAHIGRDPLSKLPLGDQDFEVEDWWVNVYGESWMTSNGNHAACAYGLRIGLRGDAVPVDNDVLYGKISGRGFLIHVSELCLPEEGEVSNLGTKGGGL